MMGQSGSNFINEDEQEWNQQRRGQKGRGGNKGGMGYEGLFSSEL